MSRLSPTPRVTSTGTSTSTPARRVPTSTQSERPGRRRRYRPAPQKGLPKDRFRLQWRQACRSCCRSGAAGEALGRSRGGLTTKIHLVAEGKCRLLSVQGTGTGQRRWTNDSAKRLVGQLVDRPITVEEKIQAVTDLPRDDEIAKAVTTDLLRGPTLTRETMRDDTAFPGQPGVDGQRGEDVGAGEHAFGVQRAGSTV